MRFRRGTCGDEDDPAGVTLGDVDGDGDPDVVIGQHFNSTIGGGEAAVRLYLNDTAAGSIVLRDVTDEAGLVGLPTKAPHVALVDVDNDGHLDLVTTAAAADGPAVFMHAGTPAGGSPFRPPVGLGSDHYWVAGPTADADRDGRLDLFLVEWDPAFRRGCCSTARRPATSFGSPSTPTLGGGPGTVVAAYEAGGAGDPEGSSPARDQPDQGLLARRRARGPPRPRSPRRRRPRRHATGARRPDHAPRHRDRPPPAPARRVLTSA